MGEPLTLADLTGCFGGLVPAVLATVSAGGIPNVTYLSRAHPVDTERIAVSNQFLSKSSRNVAEEPRASLLLVRPETHEEYRLSVVYERTERQGPVFDRLRNDLSMVAALTGMEEVFRLSSADVYRVVRIEQVTHVPAGAPGAPETTHPGSPGLGELCERLSRCGDLDTMLSVLGVGLDDLFGYRHSQLLLLDEAGQGLFTIATHGYRTNGVGAETALGQGLAGTAAARCAPVVVANSSQLNKYSSTIRRSYEESGEAQPGGQIPMVGLARPGSQLAVPALALGHLVGVLVIEDEQGERFGPADAAMVTAIATILASTIETLRTEVRTSGAVGAGIGAGETAPRASSPLTSVRVRHFVIDGSTFVDGDYLIKGVAGRILWSLLRQHVEEGRTEFTNREVRLDPTLDLPDFRDNFESRLIVLKRRLDERELPIRIEKTGRGRFRLVITARPLLEVRGDQ